MAEQDEPGDEPIANSGHFSHCSYFSSPLWGSEKYYATLKYPHVLYAKPSNKVYVFTVSKKTYFEQKSY